MKDTIEVNPSLLKLLISISAESKVIVSMLSNMRAESTGENKEAHYTKVLEEIERLRQEVIQELIKK